MNKFGLTKEVSFDNSRGFQNIDFIPRTGYVEVVLSAFYQERFDIIKIGSLIRYSITGGLVRINVRAEGGTS